MPAQFRMYIVRHGETEWNRIHKIQGHLDVPLNETGSKQAMLVAKALKDIPFVKAFSSDLQRASKTAECILQYHPDTVLELDESIRERYMGELQGEIGPSKKPAPSYETTPNLVARCLAWYLRSIVNYMTSALETGLPVSEEPHNILVVSHGGWIATLLLALRTNGLVTCREGVQIGHCLNTSVSIIEYTGIRNGRDEALVGTLVQYSGVEHLMHADLHLQEVNVDVLEDRGRKVRVG
ncbi:phosphoglycerate mutase-like protein [Imleria badia]|nr:phosphoglycerate mutase-like protein [Imleria badia]